MNVKADRKWRGKTIAQTGVWIILHLPWDLWGEIRLTVRWGSTWRLLSSSWMLCRYLPYEQEDLGFRALFPVLPRSLFPHVVHIRSALDFGQPGGASLLHEPGLVTSLLGVSHFCWEMKVWFPVPLWTHRVCLQTFPILQGLFWACGSGLYASLFPPGNPSIWIYSLPVLLSVSSSTSFSITVMSLWKEKSNISLFLIQPQILI